MANPIPSYRPPTGDAVIDGSTTGYQWNLDASRTVDYSISGGFAGEYWYSPNTIASYMSVALSTFSYFANIRFNYLGSFPNPTQAGLAGSEINLSVDGANRFFNSESSWAVGFFPSPYYINYYPGYPSVAGDIYINALSAANALPSYEPGSQGWFLLLHELGHALGLKHPHDDGGTGRPTFVQIDQQALDRDIATIMSYNDDANWNALNWDPATPMILDVLALQALYGKNQNTNARDSIYQLTQSGFYETLWDAGGNDDINVSATNAGWTIVLPNKPYASIVDTKVGFAMPTADYLAEIPRTLYWLAGDYENINASPYSDDLLGNDTVNFFKTNGGNDLIDGGAGLDTVIFSDSLAAYAIQNLGDRVEVVRGGSGSNDSAKLTNIERLQFTDASVALDVGPSQHAGSVYMLYKAAFNRAPDLEGMGYWLSQVDQGKNIVTDIAQGFVRAPEFITKYGSNPTNAFYVDQLYQNVLGRTGEAEGVAYWNQVLNEGQVSKAYALQQFSALPEGAALVVDVIANGIVYQM